MKIRVENIGEHPIRPIRVILDHDTVNDFELVAGGDDTYEALEGVIELRELDMGNDEQAEPET